MPQRNAPSNNVVTKSIFRIFVLRVSGKGDVKGAQGQLEVLQEHLHVPGVQWLLAHFDPALMQASSVPGKKLRAAWERDHGLEILHRQGRQDFLGLSVVVDGTRFVIYASTAAQLDEANGNAFTRHLCRFMAEDAFTGHADPEFMRRRDDQELDGDHPSVVTAFDITRFVRSSPQGNALYQSAVEGRAAFDVAGIRVDPEDGDHTALLWGYMCFGSEMEASVGKIRRFVGQLNLARAGYHPYHDSATPLGFTTRPCGQRRELVAAADLQPQIEALYRHGMAAAAGQYADIAEALGEGYGVVSKDCKTRGTPVHELQESAASVRRMYEVPKLEAYRDHTLDLTFVGRLPNRLRPGSGHVLHRRWHGRNERGDIDALGAITYTIPAPPPIVRDADGNERPGWLAGMSAAEERAAWDALIARQGAILKRKPQSVDDEAANTSTGGGSAGVTKPIMALARMCLYTDDAAGEHGPRTKLTSRTPESNQQRGRYELRHERQRPTQQGFDHENSTLLASWSDAELRGNLADLLEQVARRLLDDGHKLGRLTVPAPRSIAEDPAATHKAQIAKLRADADRHADLAEGFDLRASQAAMAAKKNTDPERQQELEEEVRRLEARTKEQQDEARRLSKAADLAQANPPAMPPVPLADFADLAHVIAALRGVFATGQVPVWFHRVLLDLLPGGITFEPGPDNLQLKMCVRVKVDLVNGETIATPASVLVACRRGPTAAFTVSTTGLKTAAHRYMRDGEDLASVSRLLGIADPTHTLRAIREYLLAGSRRTDGVLDTAAITQRMPCHELRAVPFTTPVPELRSLIWHHLTGVKHAMPARHRAWAASTLRVYTTPSAHPEPADGRGTSRPWTHEPNTDGRLDMLTVLHALPGNDKSMTADALAAATFDGGPRRGCHVRDASRDLPRNGQRYPATLRRLPTDAFPDGWYGKATGSLAPEEKRVSATLCPHEDCVETYATLICFAPELVTAFGTAALCRRCLRPAVATDDARRTPFPESYLQWFDSQPRRTGRWAPCGHTGCTKDVGGGVGQAWHWTGAAGKAWHDANCRAGTTVTTFTTCAYRNCQLDDGNGPGSLHRRSRGVRRWHSRACRHEEERLQRA